jgi:hypothetical protein
MEQDISGTEPDQAVQPHLLDEHYQLTHQDLPISLGSHNKGRFARMMDRFTHNLTETRETANSYRGRNSGLMAGYVVLKKTVEHQGERLSRCYVVEIKPRVSHVVEEINGKSTKVKRVVYALSHLRRHEEGQPLVADDEPFMVVDASTRMGEPGAESDQLNLAIGSIGVVGMEALEDEVTGVMGVFSDNELDLEHLPQK